MFALRLTDLLQNYDWSQSRKTTPGSREQAYDLTDSLLLPVEVDEDDPIEATRGVRQEREGEDARARSEFTDDATGSVSDEFLCRFAIPIHSPQFVNGADEADFMEAMRCIRQEQEAEDALARSEFMDDATGSVSEDSLIPLCHSYIHCRMWMQT